MQNASTMLSAHSAAISKADGLSARLISVSAGGGRTQTTVDFAKPNLLRVDTPTMLVVSNGTELVTYIKGMNVFYKKPATPASIATTLQQDQFLALRPFFAPTALNGWTSVRAGTAINRRGQELTPVSGNIDSGKRATLYISGSDSIARQVEIASTGDGRTESLIIDIADFSLSRPAASKFEFQAPAQAREVQEAELMDAKWYNNLSDALADAKRTNRPILLDFYTDWCTFCKELDAEVFSTSEFKAKARNFVLCKINPEKDPNKTQGFEVEGFPTILFLNPEGKEIGKMVGFRPVDLFIAEMDKIAGGR